MKKGCAGIPLAIPLGASEEKALLPPGSSCLRGEASTAPPLGDLRKALQKALEEPQGTAPLHELARGKEDVVILIEDVTRTTPLDVLLPPLLDHLNGCGVGDGAITLLTAPGTHRLMAEGELRAKVGASVYGRVPIVQHDAMKPERLRFLGEVRSGDCVVPVAVNGRALEADLLIGTGSIVPHADAGFSGGAKIVQPGICGLATTAATHALGIFQDETSLGIADNACRRAMEQVGEAAGLAFIVNTVKNGLGETVGLVAGHPVTAHREGASLCARSCRMEFSSPADIVVVGSKPYDSDFWQAEKALVSASAVVRSGGIVILVAACPEGLVHNHPTFRDWLRLATADIQRAVRSLPEEDVAEIIAADGAVWVARVRERARIFLVTPGLPRDDCAAIGGRSFPSLQQALDAAVAEILDAAVAVVPEGGGLLPYLASR